ncbi:G-D-S-L family lipolytic protein [Flammeovirgaceae bacterium 311]|nr:G-D-S-L family lipolytic protein [Flammeovirgaceae bacterium 311]
MKYNRTLLCIFLGIFLMLGTSVSLFAQEKKGPLRWEETIRNFEKQDQANPPEKGAILFTGSSSIVMYKDLANHFPEHQVLNRGFGGSNFTDLLHYAPRVIYPYKPSKIFIYEGDNDVASGEDAKEILKKAIQLREEIAKALPGVPVVFISPKPSVARWAMKDKYEALNRELKAYADKTKNTMYADVWTAMLDENGVVYDNIFLKDNLHMNSEGYAIWKTVLEPYMDTARKD